MIQLNCLPREFTPLCPDRYARERLLAYLNITMATHQDQLDDQLSLDLVYSVRRHLLSQIMNDGGLFKALFTEDFPHWLGKDVWCETYEDFYGFACTRLGQSHWIGFARQEALLASDLNLLTLAEILGPSRQIRDDCYHFIDVMRSIPEESLPSQSSRVAFFLALEGAIRFTDWIQDLDSPTKPNTLRRATEHNLLGLVSWAAALRVEYLSPLEVRKRFDERR